jgi:uncharacterized Zn-binding protein involved in type VI secretion
MPAAARVGDTVNTGHGCDTTTTILATGAASSVYINGLLAATQGADLALHQLPNPGTPPPACVPHPGQKVNIGSSTVRVNGKSLARVGDSADLGSIRDGSSNVFAN